MREHARFRRFCDALRLPLASPRRKKQDEALLRCVNFAVRAVGKNIIHFASRDYGIEGLGEANVQSLLARG